MQQLYSTGQLAQIIGVQAYKISYAHTTNQVREPAFRFLGKRAYTPDDVRRVAQHFGLLLGDDLSVVNTGEAR